MTGNNYTHSKTVYNSGFNIGMKSKEANLNLDITTSKTKVANLLDPKNYLYPDVVVVDGKFFFEDNNQDILVNPSLIIEVFSDLTEVLDRGDKFKSYRQIKSLKEYILISSIKKSIEQYYCDEQGHWYIGDAITEGVLKLNSLPLELSVDDVYLNVVFEATEETLADKENDKK